MPGTATAIWIAAPADHRKAHESARRRGEPPVRYWLDEEEDGQHVAADEDGEPERREAGDRGQRAVARHGSANRITSGMVAAMTKGARPLQDVCPTSSNVVTLPVSGPSRRTGVVARRKWRDSTPKMTPTG